jgi:hypothetical protein
LITESVTAALSADDSVSSRVACATTVTSPLSVSSARAALRIVSWRRTTSAVRFMVAMPDMVNVTSYLPGGSNGSLYSPPLPEAVCRGCGSTLEVAWTNTPGSTDPSAIVTLPTMLPVC